MARAALLLVSIVSVAAAAATYRTPPQPPQDRAAPRATTQGLRGLFVSPGSLVPAFAPTVRTYQASEATGATVEVEAE